MVKQVLEFAVQSKNGVVQEIGKTYMLHPIIKYSGEKTKWFDDSKLIKRGVSKHEEVHS